MNMFQHPWVRVGVFFGGATVALAAGMLTLRDNTYHRTPLPFLAITPMLIGLRYFMARMTNERMTIDLPHVRTQVIQGAALGAGAVLIENVIAYHNGWVSYPQWGWETMPLRDVAFYVALSVVGDMGVAICEEIVYRGYGLHLLQQAAGWPTALLILLPLFGLHHSTQPDVILSYAITGGMLTALRVSSGSIWLPIGWHWAYNVTETALFGNPAWHPSILPRHITGRTFWMGTPDRFGAITLAIQILTACFALILWRTRKRGRNVI